MLYENNIKNVNKEELISFLYFFQKGFTQATISQVTKNKVELVRITEIFGYEIFLK